MKPPHDQHGHPAVQPGRVAFQPKGFYDIKFMAALAKEEDTAEAQRLQRVADQAVINDLELRNFDVESPEWQVFAEVLAAYGYSVLMGWLLTGSAYQMAAAQRQGKGVHGLSKLPQDLKLGERDEAHALASEVVIAAIHRFRSNTLMNKDPSKRWRFDGGASVKTFFVGRCLMELPDAYTKWDRFERQGLDHDEFVDQARPKNNNPQVQAIDAIDLDQIFVNEDPLTRVMFELHAEGYTYEEISEMLTEAGKPTNKTKVRTAIHRARKAAKATR